MDLQERNISENNFEQCIKCTVCTAYCPVVPVNPAYPGPKQAGPDGERLRLKAGSYFDEALKYCLNCKRCEVACPSNVRIGDIIQLARMRYAKSRPSLRDRMLANTDFVGRMATTFAPIVNTTLGWTPVKAAMDGVLRIDRRRTFPSYAGQTFERWFRRHEEARQEGFDRHVSFFHGCYINYNYPDLGKDLVHVLNALGYGVHLLDREKCCGVALIANGLYDQARRQALTNMESIRRSVTGERRPVIVASSTCTFTMRDEYPHVLGVGNEDVRDGIDLVTRFVYRIIDSGEARLRFRDDVRMKAAYHTACHMERLGWSCYSIALLRMIPTLELTLLPSQCCGIAGTYGFKKENYAVSQGIGAPLFKTIEQTDAEWVVTECETCKWQIEMSTSRRVLHPISVLARMLDLEGTAELNNRKTAR